MSVQKIGQLADIANYYSEKLASHGSTPRGVDWNSAEGQKVRFKKLCELISPDKQEFSLNDLGCGYGALLDYLNERFPRFEYMGVDISSSMIEAAEQRFGECSNARFINAAEPDAVADYGMASGIFNVRLERTDAEWYEYLISTLDTLNRTSSSGFSFNCLTAYADEERKQDYLFYADPCELFDLCKRRYSRHVALMHDYALYEFTIVVRKSI